MLTVTSEPPLGKPETILSLINRIDGGGNADYAISDRESTYDIQYVVIHTTEGPTAQSAIDWWFDAQSGSASAHYIVDNGTIYQTVADKDIAYHAGTTVTTDYNYHGIGIEHVAFANTQGTLSDAEYRASADLTGWLCQTYNIPIDRDHIIGHSEVPGTTRIDPGPYFNWDYYMSLVTGGSSPATIYSLTPVSTTPTEDNATITFTVTRSGSFPAETLYVRTLFDTASAPGDFDEIDSQPLVDFAAGDTTKTFTVGINEDTVPEGATPEHFRVMIARNTTDGSAQALDISDVYIRDDDSVSAWSFDANNKSVPENQGSVTFLLTRSNPIGQETVYIRTVQDWNGNGTYNQSDYVDKLAENLTFADGVAQRTVMINIADDQAPENTETFGLIVQSSPNAVASSFLTSASFTITDNDSAPPPQNTLHTEAQLFVDDGGKITTLAKFAAAAYNDTDGRQVLQSLTNFGQNLGGGWDVLNAAEFPTISARFVGNYYKNDNAQALIARSQDALVLSFTGTDGDLTDYWNWVTLPYHYAKFADLFGALDSYVGLHSEITTIYVTGHSLGGAMVHAYMGDHQNDGRYEALTLASPGYWAPDHPVYFTVGIDSRIINFWNEDDPIQAPAYLLSDPGDDNTIYFGDTIDSPVWHLAQHDVTLYAAVMDFITEEAGQAATESLIGSHENIIVPITSLPVGLRSLTLGIGQGYFYPGEASDTLTSGIGNDLLFGGALSDSYVFNRLVIAFQPQYNGNDTIVDSAGIDDTIILGAGTTLKAMSRHGSDVWIYYDTGSAQLSKITIANYEAHPVESLQWNGTTFSIDAELHSLDQQADFNATSATAQAPGSSFNASAIIGFTVDANLLTQTATFLSSLNPFGNSVLASVANSDGLSAAVASDGIDGTTQAIVGFRDLIGTEMGDRLIGDTQDNILDGGDGADYIEGGDGNDVLIGAAGDDSVSGSEGNDIVIDGPGDDNYDGGSGIDIAGFSGNRSGYTITGTVSGYTVSGAEGSNTLTSIERFQFPDEGLAFDLGLGEAAGNSVRIMGAAFDANTIQQRPDYVGIGLDLFDGGWSMQQVCALALGTNLYLSLAASTSNVDFVNTVYKNVVGAAPSPQDRDYFVGLLQGSGGTMTQAELLMFAANTDANALNIDLVGLQQNGVEFV